MTKSQPGDCFQPGDLLNNTYRVEAILGRGGTSEVYLARSEISGRRVAVKALRTEFAANADYLVLMTREEDVRDIRHEAVVRYYDNQRTPEGQVYLVMDYVDGPGLDDKLKAGGMPASDLLVLAERVAGGLAAAHAHNIIHRDLSPDNIILKDGDPAQAIIIDFGIAKDTKPGAETIVGNEFAGKYAYAAPEQLSGNTDARSDVYSLGAVLLAAFRGKVPDTGSNPMEVVRRKAERLDTTGVPEPLKSLIDRMTDPDPEGRPQGAEALLALLRTPEPDALDDRTVIAAPPAKPSGPAAGPAKATAPRTPPPAPPSSDEAKGRGGLFAGLGVVALLLAAGGAYLSGALDPFLGVRLPTADPYSLLVAKGQSEPPRAIGHVPSDDARATLEDMMNRAGGEATLTLAAGDIAESWGEDAIGLIDRVSVLDEYRLEFTGNEVSLTGLANERATRTALLQSLGGDGMPAALRGTVEIEQGPRILPLETARTLLQEHADCGPLRLVDPPAFGYGLDASVVVSGKLAEPAGRVALFDDLRAVAGDRQIVIDADILNPALCLIDTALPAAPPGGFKVIFGFGDRPDANPGGRYFVGENPVIDIAIPEDVSKGSLWVTLLDVSGNVFHLLPNLNRQDNDIASLRAGQDGSARVRVAFSLAEAADDPARLAFLVDDSTLGKSKVIVLHSSGPLFEDLRPTTESAAGFAQALAERTADGASLVLSLDSAILETARP